MTTGSGQPAASMSEGELFDAAFVLRAAALTLRPETDADAIFLAELFAACAPLAGIVPPQFLALQSASQQASYQADYPDAMYRIVLDGEVPIGRIVVDWPAGGASHGVDIAVLPAARATGAGPHMLRAWLDVADRLGRSCSLDVLADNRAGLLYRRLGFVLADESDQASPVLLMVRAARKESSHAAD